MSFSEVVKKVVKSGKKWNFFNSDRRENSYSVLGDLLEYRGSGISLISILSQNDPFFYIK